jgi:hypothetical protein
MKNDALQQLEWHWNFFKVNVRETRRKQLSTVLVITLSQVATQLFSHDHHRHSTALCSTLRSGRQTDVLSLIIRSFSNIHAAHSVNTIATSFSQRRFIKLHNDLQEKGKMTIKDCVNTDKTNRNVSDGTQSPK